MGRSIKISWPQLDVSVQATLADEQNPELCDDFWSVLPFQVLQEHPVVSGQSVYAWVPLVSTAPIRHRERIIDAPVGRLRYSQATGNKFTVQYGRGLEPLQQPVLGAVDPGSISQIGEVGRAIWQNTFWGKEEIYVVVERSNDLTPPNNDAKPPLAPIARALHDEAKRIMAAEPEDLRRIRLGQVPDTGSYGQYFSAWDFANGMLRDYVMYTLYPLLRLALSLEPRPVSLAFDELDPNYSSYLGYSGLGQLRDFANEVGAALRESTSRESTEELLRALIMYGNRLCAWSYHYFPWHIGVFYRREVNGQEFPGRWHAMEE